MARSSRGARGLYRLLLAGAALIAGAPAPAQVFASAPLRLVSVIDISEHDSQVDLTMVFNCSMRFISNLPASEGKEVRIQLAPLPDCGLGPLALVATETPPVLGGAGIVRGARLEGIAPGQVTLSIAFNASEQFVLAQGADPHALRLGQLVGNCGKLFATPAFRSNVFLMTLLFSGQFVFISSSAPVFMLSSLIIAS